MDAVYQHGCTWRYDFNARKSGVLVFGEDERRRRINAENRVFKLGPAKVKEGMKYDHVGVKTSTQNDSCTGLEVRKLLFIRSIMILDDENLTKRIFIERAIKFFANKDEISEEWSIVADLLNTAGIFKLTNEIKNMVERKRTILY